MAQRYGQPPPPPPPRIPESWVSAADQRFYTAAIAGGLQVYKLSDALFHFYKTTLSTSVVPTTSTFLSPIAIINRFLHLNLGNWIPFLSLDASAASTYLTKWLMWDWAVIALVMWLRVPGLRYGKMKGLVYAVLFTLLDAMIFGTLGVWAHAANLLLFVGKVITNTRGQVTTLGNKAAKPWKVIEQESHLSGHRSIRVLPHGTVVFNPLSSTYCLPSANGKSGEPVLIPLITNNSEPYKLTYSIHSLSDIDTEAQIIPIEASVLQPGDRRVLQKRSEEDEEDVDDYYLDGRSATPRPPRQPHSGPSTGSALDSFGGSPIARSIRPNDKVSSLPRSIDPSQTIYYLPIQETGSITLLSVQDADGSVFRIQKTSRTALIIECPSGAEILGIEGESKEPEFKWKNVLVKREKEDNHVRHRCVGSDDVVQMSARGVGDLKMGYLIREGKGKDRRVIEEGVLSGIQTDAFNSASLRQPLLLKDKPEGTVEANRQVALRNSETALTLDWNLQVANAAATLPLRLSIAHRQVGTYTIELLNVTDSRGNFVRPSHMEAITFEVHALPVVSFTNHCAQPRTLRLLENGTVTLPIIMPGARQVPDGTTKVKVAYKATVGDEAWQREYEIDGKSLAVEVGQPGTYTLESATSTYCAGVVNEPATCVVEAVPVPKAEVEMTSLSNECAGDTGVQGNIKFIGTPPFRATYKVESGNRHVATKHVNSNSVMGHFTETPSAPGQYTFTVVSISDKHYTDIPIKQQPFRQTVHPLPKLVVSSRGRHSIWSCATNQTTAHFALTGMGPLEVDYTVSWPSDSYSSHATFSKAGNHHIDLDVPSAVAATGGSFTVTFTNIKDVNGCSARASDQSIPFDVKTTRPTAKFGEVGAARVSQVVEGSSARAVIRLTGEGPWTVGYVHSDNPKKIINHNVNSANAPLTLDRKGTYRLVQVADAHCPGHIIDASDTFELTYYDRPAVQLPAELAQHKKGQNYKRSAICAGVDDHVAVDLRGASPFHVRYRHDHTLPDKTKYAEEKAIDSAQETGILHMVSQPGLHRYTVLAVKDAHYDFDSKSLQAAKGLFSIEQEVFGKPTAGFRPSPRLSYCVGQPFKASTENNAVIEFVGQGPFEVDLALGPTVAHPIFKKTVSNIKGNTWKVDLPDHIFSHVGSQTLWIASVRDASGCPMEIANDERLYLPVDVLETSSITAVSDRDDYCVGDMLEFVLGGTAPWHVAYKFNKKSHNVVASNPQFYRLAEKAGELEIKSVSNKNSKCSATVEDIKKTIHALPKAKIEEGKPWLHEGAETEIVFSFQGTPPFTFTYTRSISDGRRSSKIVDTQTVTDISTNTYTLTTAMEGEYDVTYVKDAYCSYPPEPRLAESNQKLLKW